MQKAEIQGEFIFVQLCSVLTRSVTSAAENTPAILVVGVALNASTMSRPINAEGLLTLAMSTTCNGTVSF